MENLSGDYRSRQRPREGGPPRRWHSPIATLPRTHASLAIDALYAYAPKG